VVRPSPAADSSPTPSSPATTSVSADAPYLYTDARGAYRVDLAAVQRDSIGTSWAGGATAGTSKPLGDFFVATPRAPVGAINLNCCWART
jgi:hypothetical protein